MIGGVGAVSSAISNALSTPVVSQQPVQEAQSSLFQDMLHSVVEQSRQLDQKATQSVVGLLSGQGVEVHDAMIATQKAELAFELALQVRNKAVSAYQQMMQMQF